MFTGDKDRKNAWSYWSNCNKYAWMLFETRYDLSGGVDVYVAKTSPKEAIIQSITGFILYWSRDILPELNGFSGLDNVHWRIHELDEYVDDESVKRYKENQK